METNTFLVDVQDVVEMPFLASEAFCLSSMLNFQPPFGHIDAGFVTVHDHSLHECSLHELAVQALCAKCILSLFGANAVTRFSYFSLFNTVPLFEAMHTEACIKQKSRAQNSTNKT